MDKINKVLIDLAAKKDTEFKHYWNIDTDGGEFLCDLIKKNNRNNILEIGSSNGYSAILMASVLKEGGKILTIESHKERNKQALENIKAAGLESVITALPDHAPLCFSRDSFPKKKFDFVFLDCIKKYYGPSMDVLFPEFLEEDIIIVADNMLSHVEASQNLVDWFENNKDIFIYKIHDIGTGMLVAKKKI